MKKFEVFDIAFYGIILTNKDGVIVFTNIAAQKMLGYSKDELIGKPVEMLIPESARHSHVEKRSNYVDSPSSRLMSPSLSFAVLRKDSSKFRASIGLNSIEVDGVKLISVSLQDITVIEEQANQEAHAVKMERLGEVAMGIAHNFNNFITGIKGNAFLLKKHLDDEGGLKKLSRIDELCEQSTDLVKQLMVYGRVECHVNTNFNITKAIKKLVCTAKLSLNKNIELSFESIEKTRVFGDKAQILQVIYNLVNNASHAIGEAQGKIEISCFSCNHACENTCGIKRDMSQRVVCIDIKDSGHGIGDETIKKIFNPFFTTKSIDQGTGLGLATAKATVEKYGGEMFVDSIKGKGTNFHFYLPVFEGKV